MDLPLQRPYPIPTQCLSRLSGWVGPDKFPYNQVYSAEQTRQLEAAIIQQGTSASVLMRRAATASFRLIHNRWKYLDHMVIYAGVGNNAGDAYGVAAVAVGRGWTVNIITLGEPKTQESKAMQQWAIDSGVNIHSLDKIDEQRLLDLISMKQAVHVDALFGIGLNREIQGRALELIQDINRHLDHENHPVVSLDIPSGLNASTGSMMPESIKATATVSFLGLKTGQLTHRGKDAVGDLYVDTLKAINMDDSDLKALASDATISIASRQKTRPILDRNQSQHKQSSGHLLVWAGSGGMQGAGALVCQGAIAAGCGKVTWLTNQTLPATLNQVLTHPAPLEPKDIAQLPKAQGIVVGPGLQISIDLLKELSQYCLERALPLVIDASALASLEKLGSINLGSHTVLTPHPKEAAALLHDTVKNIQSNRKIAVSALAKRFGCTVLLKGAGTWICDAENFWLAPQGNPILATAGTGDILSGVIGANLARGLTSTQAACQATSITGTVADRLATVNGPGGLLLDNLITAISREYFLEHT